MTILKMNKLIKDKIYKLTNAEQKVVELVAFLRQTNKEETGWNGKGTISESEPYDLNRNGFGAEFIFCREYNLHPDFSISNTSKQEGTDKFDAVLNGTTIDIKSSNKNHPLMIAEYLKSNVDYFAYFLCKYPEYKFMGYASNDMIFKEENLRQTKVLSYVLEQKELLDEINK